jgi:hypothetical protein
MRVPTFYHLTRHKFEIRHEVKLALTTKLETISNDRNSKFKTVQKPLVIHTDELPNIVKMFCHKKHEIDY